MDSKDHRSAFTLIELMIVIAISALLSALAITFSSVGRNEVALSVETSKISGFILQAKELSIATYSASSPICGYGFTLDANTQTYSIFAYSPVVVPPCPALGSITTITSDQEKEYTPGTWQIHVSNGVVIQPAAESPDSLVTVLFYPPDPAVLLSNDGITFENPATTLNVYLKTVDGQNSATIGVNPEGQVDF
jgi:prepilin-type N-terminal cleavage/methylation domain-containing protein